MLQNIDELPDSSTLKSRTSQSTDNNGVGHVQLSSYEITMHSGKPVARPCSYMKLKACTYTYIAWNLVVLHESMGIQKSYTYIQHIATCTH